jgi:phenylpyruvate tautomerase PptA (4-oxalocrotonate tautomerase family)
MPIIEIKVFEQRFDDPEFSERMIAALSDAVTSVLGPEAGADTTVVLQGLPQGRLGYGGRQVGAAASQPADLGSTG